MMKKIVLFSVSDFHDDLVAASALSFEFRKNQYKTILFCEKSDINFIKNDFDEIYYFPKLLSNFKFIFYSFYLFFYSLILSFKVDILISHQGKISFFLKFFFYFFRKNFFIIQLNNLMSFYDQFFSYKCKQIFYAFYNTSFKKESLNKSFLGIPLPYHYKFSYKKHDDQNFIITFFLSKDDVQLYLNKISEILSCDIKQKITIQILEKNDELTCEKMQFNDIVFKKKENDFSLIKESHLIVCYPSNIFFAKVCAIGRPVFLVFDQNVNTSNINIDYFLNLKNIAKGDFVLLADLIKKLIIQELFFYETCKEHSLLMLSNARINIFKTIDNAIKK